MHTQFEENANPADILMDILSGKGVNPVRPFSAADLVREWECSGSKWSAETKTGDSGVETDGKVAEAARPLGPEDLGQLVSGRGAPWVLQAALCHNRYLLQQYRRVSALALEVGVASLAGGLMGIAVQSADGELYKGILVSPYELLSPSTLQWLMPQLTLLIGMACGLAGAPAGVKVFGEEKPIYWREAAAGHNRLAYYIGKTLSTLYRSLLAALHFAAIFTWLAAPASDFALIFGVVSMLFFCVYGLAAIVSMLVRRENAALLAVVACLFAAVICGYGPTITNARQWKVSFVWDISFNRWAAEAFVTRELEVYSSIYKLSATADEFGYALDGNVARPLGYMCLLGVAFRAVAFVLMVVLDRDMQR
ncbi:hypothetical protein HK405_006988 [Cladochytrium tenue]|nr:hypothetical protein HK405_006988 [Cladochytrium tenue]